MNLLEKSIEKLLDKGTALKLENAALKAEVEALASDLDREHTADGCPTCTGVMRGRIVTLEAEVERLRGWLPSECFVCPQCSVSFVSVDEDGCCVTCGGNTVILKRDAAIAVGKDMIDAALAPASEEEVTNAD